MRIRLTLVMLVMVCCGACAQDALQERFERLDADGDGRVTAEEARGAGWFERFDADDDGAVTLEEARAGVGRQGRQTAAQRAEGMPLEPGPTAAEQALPDPPGWDGPPLRRMPEGDATDDASGLGQLFESVVVPGVTDVMAGTNGFAIADLNGDGLMDLLVTQAEPRSWGGRIPDRLRILLNEDNFTFIEHPITIVASDLSCEAFGSSAQIPNLADLNRDGYLDILISRHAPSTGGRPRPGAELRGNTLLVSNGAWDRFEDLAEQVGVRNELAYNRQTSIGDVDGDGWLDIAVGCDNIGNAMGGVSHSRLYVYRPAGDSFGDGRFEDVGDSEVVPDFGGFYSDPDRDRASPGITLRDLDGDGDLDLIQSYHADIRDPLTPLSPGNYRQGMFCWRNLLAETGELRFEQIEDNGLAEEARLRYDEEAGRYDVIEPGPGLPYVSVADVDNNGLPDVLAVGPADPGWAPRGEYVTGRYWRNLGEFSFEEATEAAGLAALNWTYRDWFAFWDAPISEQTANWEAPRRGYPAQPAVQRINPLDRGFYSADTVVGDFDNDGSLDFVLVDRKESFELPNHRAVLFMGTGEGSFEPKNGAFSGLDGSGISGEAADLNNDGLLDLIFAADPDNSGLVTEGHRYQDKVYVNTGAQGARENHWLRSRLEGISDGELIGARVEAREPETGALLGVRWVHSNHSYKSGGSLEVHFGLGECERVDLRVRLLDGRELAFEDIGCDRYVTLDVDTGEVAAQ